MNGITMNAMPAGLLAKKGAAKPAMRRQSPVQQTGFGASSSMTGMSGWLTGAEDDCGWNDMGDTPAHAPGGSVIGLTPVSDKADSLYLHSNGEDWDEAEGYDEDQRAEPGWTPAPVAAANPVGAMQSRLREAATPAPEYTASHAPAFERQSVYEEQVEETPVGLFGHVRATIAHLFAMIFGRGPVLVVLEAVYSVTDPPIKALRRVVPPLRLGSIALDLSFLIVFISVWILRSVVAATML